MIRSVMISEPLWTPADLAELEALAVYRATLCPCGCGWTRDDALSDETTGPAFTASRIVCRARLAMIETERAVDAEGRSPMAGARLWSTRKVDRA